MPTRTCLPIIPSTIVIVPPAYDKRTTRIEHCKALCNALSDCLSNLIDTSHTMEEIATIYALEGHLQYIANTMAQLRRNKTNS